MAQHSMAKCMLLEMFAEGSNINSTSDRVGLISCDNVTLLGARLRMQEQSVCVKKL
jgi:hypothetical protein